MIVLEVAIPVPLNKTFYYLPIEDINPENIVGRRVKVPFGKKKMIAYAISCKNLDLNADKDNFPKLKRIIEVVDDVCLLTKETITLADYISKNYICSLGEAFLSIVPVSMRPSKRTMKNKNLGNDDEVIEGFTRSILNKQQSDAVSLINKTLEKSVYDSFLLHGVTASGKTEVYMNVIEYTLKQNRSAIMLIPEISLTPQFVRIMTKRFGSKVGVWHSGIGNIAKYELFSKAKKGVIKIMVGARSAVFAPFENLGIIIIDEEHEHTYKQKQKPSYDTREIAKWRGSYHNATVVFGSATPSLESYKDALENRMHLIELSERVNKKEFPEIKIVSLKNRVVKSSLLLPETVSAISETLARKEQVIVFLNRRGYSSLIMCKNCESVYQCTKCSISMVLHRNPDVLKCHYCGLTKYLPIKCSSCGSGAITVFGTGTQKIEYELKKLFKNAKIFRLDSDTTSSKKNYELAYSGIKNKEYDILLGTQMIAKGFDFPNVSLVCVVNADTSLYFMDFKSVEKTFQLITQVAGRSGRGNTKGNVIVQTNHPHHYAIEYAKDHNYVLFYRTEIEQRRKLFYPPYCDIAKILIKNKDKEKANRDSENLFSFLENLTKDYKLELRLLGPVSAYIAKLDSVYRKHIIVKGSREKIIELAKFLENFKRSSGTLVSVEIMPLDLI